MTQQLLITECQEAMGILGAPEVFLVGTHRSSLQGKWHLTVDWTRENRGVLCGTSYRDHSHQSKTWFKSFIGNAKQYTNTSRQYVPEEFHGHWFGKILAAPTTKPASAINCFHCKRIIDDKSRDVCFGERFDWSPDVMPCIMDLMEEIGNTENLRWLKLKQAIGWMDKNGKIVTGSFSGHS